jgi:membrane associated rhomboid family serine protease
MLIPIGTDVRTPRLPIGNYVLMALNVAIFLVTDVFAESWRPGLGADLKAFFALDGARPSLHQYLTYQFLHGDLLHLAGNMLFLWIFGNAVCDRMGTRSYILFYLGGGVFAGIAFAFEADSPLVGASGSIAAVTTAFLALFPRVHVTMLVWMIIIFTFQIPGWILITFKIILWDNVIAFAIESSGGAESNIAFSAHLGGYAFGFGLSLLLLLARALPRNQFDIIAVWNRRARRHGLVVGGGNLRHPVGARPIRVQELSSRPIEEVQLTPVEQLREDVALALSEREPDRAIQLYQKLRELAPDAVLAANNQLEVANHLAQRQQHAAAAVAYEAYLNAYPVAADTPEVRLFLGLVYRRYLHNEARAAIHLRKALEGLRLEAQRILAEEELRQALKAVSDDLNAQ